MFENIATRTAESRRVERSTAFEQPFDPLAHGAHPALKFGTSHGAVANSVPMVKEQLRAAEQIASDLAARAASRRKSRELAHQVRPAYLATFHRPEQEYGRAIADQKSAGSLEQAFDRVARTIFRDREDGHQRRRNRPQSTWQSALRPARSIDMLDGLGADEVGCLFHGRRDRLADSFFRLAERTERDPDAHHVVEQLDDQAPAHSVWTREQSDQRQEPRREHPAGNTGWKFRSGNVATVRALACVQTVLGNVRLDLRKLGDLMAQRIRLRDGRQCSTTLFASVREMIFESADILARHELALMHF